MAKIILNDGSEEYLTPGAAEAKVRAGEAVWGEGVPMYSTRQMVAEPPKKRRKRKPKVEQPKVEEPKAEEVKEVDPPAESEQVDTDETE